jgi:hypothetical protein
VDAQRDFGTFACRHYGQASEVDGHTLVQGDGLRVGDWARVRVTASKGYDLLGEMVPGAVPAISATTGGR